MSHSIMQDNKNRCYLCGRNKTADPCGLEEHHAIGGSNRKWSEKYGLKVYLCGLSCHREGPKAVHKNKTVNNMIKAAAQRAFIEKVGTREEFYQIFGRYYD